MSTIVTTDVVCDKCGSMEFGCTSNRAQPALARRVVRSRQRWERHHDAEGVFADLCPDCAARRKFEELLERGGIQDEDERTGDEAAALGTATAVG